MKVTRIAYSGAVNAGKYGELVEQARRLGRVRSLVWDRYTGVGLSDRQIRDAWMADGTAASCGVLANAWKETVRDAVADIRRRLTSTQPVFELAKTSHRLRYRGCQTGTNIS